jgi:membrane protease YdiL (CAAX protease family)
MAVTVGLDLILRQVDPGIDARRASLWIVALVSVALAIGVSAAGWWRDIGYTPLATWRALRWLVVALVIALAPLLAGIRAISADVYLVLLAGFVLTGFAEETMFRGVLVRLLDGRSPLLIAAVTALLFGCVHLSNIVIRGEVMIILAQAVGAAAFGFGFAALRLRTNALPALVGLHAVHDLVLQTSVLPLIPTAVVQDVLLFGLGLWLLRPGGTLPEKSAEK